MLVDGIDFSDDKMLQGRTLSYSDTQRYRVGAELPAAADQCAAAGGARQHQPARRPDDLLRRRRPEPARQLRAQRPRRRACKEAPQPAKDYHQPVEGHLGRYQTSRVTDDYKQAGDRYRSFEDWERDDLIANLVDDMKACPEPLALRMVWHFWHCDEDYGRRVAQGAGIDLEKAKALPPLPGRPAPHQALKHPTYSDGKAEEATRQAAE